MSVSYIAIIEGILQTIQIYELLYSNMQQRICMYTDQIYTKSFAGPGLEGTIHSALQAYIGHHTA